MQCSENTRSIEAPTDLIATNIKALYQNPYHHYTFVAHLSNGFLSLYDEKVKAFIASSNKPFPDEIKLLAFAKNYGEFYVYLEGRRHALHSSSSSPQLIRYQINQSNRLASTKLLMRQNRTAEYQSMFVIPFKTEDERQQALLLFSAKNYCLVDLNGRTISAGELRLDGQLIQAIKSYQLKENLFLFVEADAILTGTLEKGGLQLKGQLRFEEAIQDVIVDFAVHKRYIGILTKTGTVHFAVIASNFRHCYSLSVPNLFITRLCFFYPAANTSYMNKYKDRVFVVFQGVAQHFKGLSKKSIDPWLRKGAICIQQFKITFLSNEPQLVELIPSGKFDVEAVEAKSIFFNEQDLNCVRVLSEDNQLISYSLSYLFDRLPIDAEWIYLMHKFEPCHNNQSYELELREGQFDEEMYTRKGMNMHIKVKDITEEELNDWSYSCFKAEEFIRLKNRRYHFIF